MKTINICYMINEKYMPLTMKSIENLKRCFRSKKHQLKIYIIGIDDFDVPDDVTFIKSDYTDLPILWQRVYMPEMLGVDKFIFIDSDTIAMTCVSKLWDIDIGDNILAAAQHLQCQTFETIYISTFLIDFHNRPCTNLRSICIGLGPQQSLVNC